MSKSQTTAKPGLIRALGPVLATAIVIGSVIGSGVFKNPRLVAANVDYFGLIVMVWVLGGILALLGTLTLGELGALFPEAGGSYVFLRESFGRLAAFLFGWVEFWIIQAAGLAALATVFTDELANVVLASPVFRESGSMDWFGAPLSSFWGRQFVTVGMIMVMAGINIRGVLWGGWMQSLITSVKIATLIGILALPFIALAWSGGGLAQPRPEYLSPVWPSSWDRVNLAGFGIALVGVLWAYNGWMNLAFIAGEIKQPQRNLPLALLAGTGVIIFLYLGANLAYALVLPRQEMAELKNVAVVTRFAEVMLGPQGSVAASAALMISVFGAFNGCLLTAPRVVFAMSEDGLAPRALAKVHPSYHTPARSIMVFAVWSALLVLGAAAITQFRLPDVRLGDYAFNLNVPKGQSPFDLLTGFAIFGVVLFETLALASIFTFRRTMPNAERAYRCIGYPWVPIIYIAIMVVVAGHMFVNQRTESLAGLAFIAVGAGVYGIISRGRKKE